MTKPTDGKNREESVGAKAYPEHLHTLNKDDVLQDQSTCSHGGKDQQDKQPPPLTAGAQELCIGLK